MKTKKLTCIAMTLILIFSVFSMNISATGNDEISFVIDKPAKDMVNKIYYSEASELKLKTASSSATSYKLYAYIPEQSKAIYNQLLEDDAGISSAPQGLIELNMSRFGKNLSEAYLLDAVCYACAALSDDYPEYQWLLSAPFEVSYKGSTGNLKLKVLLSELPYRSWRDIEADYYSLLDAVKTFPVEGTTRYEKVKSIHDNLAALAEYDYSIDSNTAPANSKVFYPSSALLYPYKTVCDGYSKAFKMICEKNKIPCLVIAGYAYTLTVLGFPVSGGGHAWNYVQMEDGKWYAIDLTWNDQVNSAPIYDYFLVGSDTKDSQGKAFSSTHVATGDRFVGLSLTYPALSTQKYTPKVVTPQVDPYSLGDVNGDGNITLVDAKYVLQSVADTRVLEEIEFISADVNKDNYVTLIDAKWILQYVADLRTF